ncbi:hypothetical protein AGROH133_08691 [Agrobacterium tumefaciens]|nr:hypothetical protein AGROH133_08691 [Agrobacterium tumefaciens]
MKFLFSFDAALKSPARRAFYAFFNRRRMQAAGKYDRFR